MIEKIPVTRTLVTDNIFKLSKYILRYNKINSDFFLLRNDIILQTSERAQNDILNYVFIALVMLYVYNLFGKLNYLYVK